MIQVGKPINGISLNGDEWLLNDNGTVREFKDKDEAMTFLRDAGIDLTDEEMEDAFTFKNIEEE